MNFKLGLIFLILILFSSLSLADQIDTLLVWIEGTLGVGAVYNSTLNLTVGEEGGTWITINNTGNVRDILRLEGQIVDSTCPNCEYKDWIKFAFKCAESVGQCDDTLSSEIKYVDGIELTPRINSTKIYLKVIGYKAVNPGVVNISITGYSLTNYTKEPQFINIELNISPPSSGGAQGEEVPGLSPLGLIALAFLSPILYKKLT